MNAEEGPKFPDSNRAGVEFLLVDLDTALIFMDVAATSEVQETVDRNHTNAHNAYNTVLHLLQNLKPDAEQRSALDGKMNLLKARLEAVGHQF